MLETSGSEHIRFVHDDTDMIQLHVLEVSG